MSQEPQSQSLSLPDDLKQILNDSFVLRTTLIRKSGAPRTIETTYYWDGANRIVLSGYPGKRDWVASIAVNSAVRTSFSASMTLASPCMKPPPRRRERLSATPGASS